ncbi:MAG TPA: KH domain-containing protein [Bdellovibrio sp.]|uniref:KH domain-containing protein n=1 Tax=Bdellovibrio sp. TaxID=28201 RepID=UPI002F168B53
MEDTSKVLVIRRIRSSEESSSSNNAPAVSSSNEIVVELGKRKLEELIQLIVDYPSEVSVSVIQGSRTTVYKVDCSQRNLGKVLGSKGKMITSLRNVILALTARHGIRSVIEVPYYENVENPCK